MTIDMLKINYSLLVAKISNSYCDGNDPHGHVANIPQILLPEATYVSQNGLLLCLLRRDPCAGQMQAGLLFTKYYIINSPKPVIFWLRKAPFV